MRAAFAQGVDLAYEDHPAALSPKLFRDMVEPQDAVAVLARTRPDRADLAGRAEDVPAIFIPPRDGANET